MATIPSSLDWAEFDHCLSVYLSKHTIVCRAAQQSGAPHRGYIDKKKENVIFTLLYLGDQLSDWN